MLTYPHLDPTAFSQQVKMGYHRFTCTNGIRNPKLVAKWDSQLLLHTEQSLQHPWAQRKSRNQEFRQLVYIR